MPKNIFNPQGEKLRNESVDCTVTDLIKFVFKKKTQGLEIFRCRGDFIHIQKTYTKDYKQFVYHTVLL